MTLRELRYRVAIAEHRHFWLLRIVQADDPRLHLAVHEDMTRHLADKLDEQILEVAFLALPAPFGQAARVEHPLFAEPFFVA